MVTINFRKIVTIERPNQLAEVWHYVYDALGRRMSKQQEGNTETLRLFTWDGARLIQEETAQHKYTYVYRDQGSFEPLAQVVEELNSEEVPKRDVYYYHTDQVGIPKEVTDTEGNLAWYGHYKAWGQLKEEHNLLNIHQLFRLQNQYVDAETGLHYNLLRYYDPHYGRFINQDPIGLNGGNNLYQFAPNATGWVDVLGLSENICDNRNTEPLIPVIDAPKEMGAAISKNAHLFPDNSHAFDIGKALGVMKYFDWGVKAGELGSAMKDDGGIGQCTTDFLKKKGGGWAGSVSGAALGARTCAGASPWGVALCSAAGAIVGDQLGEVFGENYEPIPLGPMGIPLDELLPYQGYGK